MMKMRQRRRLVNQRSLIGLRIRELLSTLDEITDELLQAEAELVQMELPSSQEMARDSRS